jgi:broad specificity phosphatase PhoE
LVVGKTCSPVKETLMAEDKKLISILQRHGSTILNEDNKFRGRMDPPLDEKGIKQAEKAAEDLKNEGIEVKRVVSSPMLRSLQTADEIAAEFGLEVEQDRALISWNLGVLSGKDRDEWEDILNLFVDNPKLIPPDGEPLDALEQRLFEYFDRELKKDKLTVYCTHNSNLVTVETLIAGKKVGRPESSEVSVEPGGAMGIFLDSEGKYSTEVLFGVEKEAQFSS